MRLAFSLLATVFLSAIFLLPAPALAYHPDDDDRARTVLDGLPWYNDPTLRDDPWCDEANNGGGYESMDLEFWICVQDQPGFGETPVPGEGGYYWEPVNPGVDDPDRPDPDSPDDLGGAVQYAKKWVPVTIPGYPGVVMRLLTRSEWVNPTGVGRCPNVVGGCRMKGGGDINFRRNGQPFQLSKTWFNRALQLYTYNFQTNAWVLRQDTGWTYAGAAAAAYLSAWTATQEYGVAPYGDTWYWVRTQARVWNGSAWNPTVVVDPKPSGTPPHLGIIDPKPGGDMNIPAPTGKPPKVKPPKKLKVAPDPS